MKFSRNPISGLMEIYTDDGVYLGIMSTMGDFVKSDDGREAKDRAAEKNLHLFDKRGEPMNKGELIKAYASDHSRFETARFALRLIGMDTSFMDDGGPGSGNWGHKGRPGEVGGSGKGGGSQYRGGRSDVGYFGSRSDWVNGLTGESQQKAVRLLKQWKPENKGGDTSSSPEENLMKNGSVDDKWNLVSLMEEARSWGWKANRLTEENWDETDKKLAKALSDKYGIKTIGGADVPEDAGKWNDADLECWLDLKSKAMGGPVSGKEPPDELQYAAGLKERPKPPEPPKAQGPDYSWYDQVGSRYGGIGFESYMQSTIGETPSYAHNNMTKDEFGKLNQRFVDSMKYGKPSPNELSYYATHAIAGLRAAFTPVEKHPWGNTYGEFSVTEEMLNRLNDSEKSQLLDICNRFTQDGFSPFDKYKDLSEMTGNDFYAVEKNMRQMPPPRSNDQKQPYKDYVLLMEKMLTGAVPAEEDPLAKAEEAKKAQRAQEAAERAKKFKAEQEEFRNSERAKSKKNAQDNIKKLDSSALRSKSRREIEKAMNDTGIFYGDKKFKVVDRISDQSYADAASAYQRVLSQYPFLAGDLGGFGDDYNSRNSKAGTYTDLFKNDCEIIINYNLFEDRDAFQRRRDLEVLNKFKVPVDVPAQEATLTHELGHSLVNWLHRVSYGSFQEKAVKMGLYTQVSDENQAADEIQSATLKAMKIRRTRQNITDNVSEYAFENSHEFFAECFCELMCSKNPRPVAVEFGKQVEKFIKAHGITNETSGTVPSALYSTISWKK